MSQAQPASPKQSAERRKAADRTPDVSGLRSMLSTDELRRRPSRGPDYAAENQALIALAQALATSPEDIVQRLAEVPLLERDPGH